MQPRLLAGIGWGTVGGAIYAACQWGMLIVLANVGSLTDVGILSIALAITAPIFLFFGLNLRVAQATDARSDFSLREYLLVRAATTLMALVVVVVTLLSWPPVRKYWVVVLLVASAKVSEAFTEVAIGRLQKMERFDLIGQMQISRGVVGLGAFVGGLLISRRLEVAVAAWSMAWFLLLLGTEKWLTGQTGEPIVVETSRAVSLANTWRLIATAAPLGFVAVMDSLVLNAPKYFLQTSMGVAEVGVFSAVTYLMAIGGIAIGAVGYAITPRLARFGSEEPARFAALITKALALALSIGVAGVLLAVAIGDWLLAIIYSPAFAEHQQTFVVVMIAATFWYVAGLLGCGLNGLRQFTLHARVQGVALAVTVIGCVVFVPDQGVLGAAMALALGMATRLMASLLALRVSLREKSDG